MDDTRRPHLTLVGSSAPDAQADEFAPLPIYTWLERPETLPLGDDEAATALHLARGDAPAAANLLKVPLHRLARLLRRSPRLQRIQEESDQLNVLRARGEYIRALDSEEARRREWGATKIMQSRAAQGDSFSPAPASSSSHTQVNVGVAREIVFSWKSPSVVDNRPSAVDCTSDDYSEGHRDPD
jgi:hypothetical protein